MSYDGKVTASVIFEGVQIGDELLYHYTVEGSNPVFDGRYVDIDSTKNASAPADWVQIRYLVPKARKLNFKFSSAHTTRRDSALASGENEVVFERKSVARYEPTPGQGPDLFIDDMIAVSEFDDWASVNAWAQKLFAYKKGTQPETKRLAEKFVADAPSANDLQRVQSVLDFVQRDIRYFGIFFGASSHRPNAADAVLSKRFGDCKDKTALLIGLLTEMGFDAYPILVSQYYRGFVERHLPSPYVFDHAIAGVTIDGVEYWLDGTRLHGAGSLASRQAWFFGQGLRVREQTVALSKAPSRPTNDFDIEAHDAYVLADWKKPATVTSTVRYLGISAEGLQAALTSPERARMEQMMFEVMDRVLGESATAETPTFAPDAATGSMLVKKTWSVAALLKLGESPRNLSTEYVAWLPAMNLRLPPNHRGDYYLGPAVRVKHLVSYEFPEDILKDPQKSESKVGDDFFSLTSKVDIEGKSAKFEFVLESFKETVPAARWSAFREKAADAQRRSAGTIRLGIVAPSRLGAFQADLNRLVADISSRKVLAATTVQERAHVDVLVLSTAIDSGRLNNKAEAQALRARGVARDHVGMGSVAREDLVRAVALDPDAAASRNSKAEIEFGLGQFDNVLKTLDHDLSQSNEEKTSAVYTRGRANFYLGKFQLAYDDFVENTKQREGAEKAFPQLWAAIAGARLGKSIATTMRELNAQTEGTGWPQKMVANYMGSLSDRDLIAAARDAKVETTKRHQLCEAHYFIGMKHLLAGNASEAKWHFEKSVDTEVLEFIEYRASKFELARLK